MALQKAHAITGVSPGREAELTRVYPSIACTGFGKALGGFYDSLPARVGGIKLSHLLCVLPTAPIALLLFFWLKVFGDLYVLTNRSVQKRAALGHSPKSEVLLKNIENVAVRQEPGQAFYPAADVYLLGKSGETLMVLSGVLRADVFRQNILEARDACRQVEASLATIKARQPAATA